MSAMSTHQILTGVVVIGLLLGGLACVHEYDTTKLEGTWDCSTSWTWDKDGESVPCAVQQQISCRDSKMSSTGVISLGAAQWDETIEGTCHVEGEELVGTRTSAQTVPKNDEARQFEQEILGGQSLASTTSEPQRKSRARITSFTETQLIIVSEEGRTTTCNRPKPQQ